MRFLRDTTIVGSGTVLAQAIQLAATPWLSRLYTPAEFGLYATFMAVAGALATASCLRFDVAIGAADECDVANLLKVAILCSLGFALFSAIALPPILRGLPDSQGLREWQAWLPIAVMSGAFFQIGNYLVIRRQKFVLGAQVKVVQIMVFVVVAALSRRLSLIGAQLLGQAIWITVLALEFRWTPLKYRILLDLVRRFKDYPLYSAPAALLDTLAVALPIIIITRYYGEDASGNFSRVRSIIGGPLLLLASSLTPVFFSRAVGLRDQGAPIRPLLASVSLWTFALGIGLILVVFVAGEAGMKLLLGLGWRTDTWFLMMTMLGIVFKAAVTPVGGIFFVQGRVKAATAWQLCHFVWTIVGLPVFAAKLSFDGFLTLLAVSECFSYSLYLILAAWRPPRPDFPPHSVAP